MAASTSSSRREDVAGDPDARSRAALRDGPLTREELAERVARRARPRLRRPAQAGRVPRRADLRAPRARTCASRCPEPFEPHGRRRGHARARPPLPHPLRPGHPRGLREVVRRTRRPPQAGRWIKALGDEVAETEFGWRSPPTSRRCEAAAPSGVVRLLPAFDQYVVAAPRDDRATRAARAHLPARRLVLARPARRRRDGGRVGARGRRGDDRAVRARSARRSAPPPRPRRRGCLDAPTCHLAG